MRARPEKPTDGNDESIFGRSSMHMLTLLIENELELFPKWIYMYCCGVFKSMYAIDESSSKTGVKPFLGKNLHRRAAADFDEKIEMQLLMYRRHPRASSSEVLQLL